MTEERMKEMIAPLVAREPDEFMRICLAFHHLLVETNKTTNLTRIVSLDEFWRKQVVDSLMISRYHDRIHQSGTRLLDVGCGAGFPSFILAIAFPDVSITAIDSIGKKTDFVRMAAEKLGIKMEVVKARARELGRKPDYQKRYDIITAKAVAQAKELFRESRAFLRDDGAFVFYKTPDKAHEEMTEVSKVSSKYDFSWSLSETFTLPESDEQRIFLIGERGVS